MKQQLQDQREHEFEQRVAELESRLEGMAREKTEQQQRYSSLSLPHLTIPSTSESTDTLCLSPSRMALPITPRFTNSGAANTIDGPTHISIPSSEEMISQSAAPSMEGHPLVMDSQSGNMPAESRVLDDAPPISIGKPCLSSAKKSLCEAAPTVLPDAAILFIPPSIPPSILSIPPSFPPSILPIPPSILSIPPSIPPSILAIPPSLPPSIPSISSTLLNSTAVISTSAPMDGASVVSRDGAAAAEAVSADEGISDPVSGSLSSPVPSRSFKKSRSMHAQSSADSSWKKVPVAEIEGHAEDMQRQKLQSPPGILSSLSSPRGPPDSSSSSQGASRVAIDAVMEEIILPSGGGQPASEESIPLQRPVSSSPSRGVGMVPGSSIRQRWEPFSAESSRNSSYEGRLAATVTDVPTKDVPHSSDPVPHSSDPVPMTGLRSPLSSLMRSPAVSSPRGAIRPRGVLSAMETFLQVIDRCQSVSCSAGTVLHRLDDDMNRLDEAHLPFFKRVLSDRTPEEGMDQQAQASPHNSSRQTDRLAYEGEASHRMVFLSPSRLPPVPAFRSPHVHINGNSKVQSRSGSGMRSGLVVSHPGDAGGIEREGGEGPEVPSISPHGLPTTRRRGNKIATHQYEQQRSSSSSSRERSSGSRQVIVSRGAASLSTQRSPIAFSFASGSTQRKGVDTSREDKYRSRSALDAAGSRRSNTSSAARMRSPL